VRTPLAAIFGEAASRSHRITAAHRLVIVPTDDGDIVGLGIGLDGGALPLLAVLSAPTLALDEVRICRTARARQMASSSARRYAFYAMYCCC
jgi:hypothetical protein